MSAFIFGALAVVGVAAFPPNHNHPGGYPSAASTSLEPDVNTATSPAAVYAAQATAATYNGPESHVPGRAFDRFVVIWLENTDFDKAASDPNMAWLATKAITLTNYFGVTHPSEPNYCASHGGDNFGMDNDDFNQIVANISSVTDLLEDKGISWGSYQQHMPYTGFEGFSWVNQETGANDYVRKHNPPVLYNVNTSPRRLSYQKNFTQFYDDLENCNLPQWMFITPNMTNDGHDSSITVAGQWTRDFLEPLMSNEYFMHNTLILVTFDENETYEIGNRVFSLLLGGAIAGREGTNDTAYYNHYSEISTVEANWGLHTLGRWDVGANVFSLVAEKTGDIIRPNEAVTGPNETIFQNSSFAGPFNTQFESAPYPAPNVNIVSPHTGRTVLPAIREIWGERKTYYTDSVVIPDGQHPPPGYAVNDVNN